MNRKQALGKKQAKQQTKHKQKTKKTGGGQENQQNSKQAINRKQIK